MQAGGGSVLVPYGYFEREERLSRGLLDALALGQCTYRALELMDALTYRSVDEFEAVIKKAKAVCSTLRIPVEAHYREIYVSSPKGLYRDYRLSRLACYLITVNADSTYPAVAKAQLYLATRSGRA
jgi:DNA-damage-inducible protein D